MHTDMFEILFSFKEYFIPLVIIAAVAYLIGCVNSSIIVTKLLTQQSDIRDMGSGNAGFTNVLRTMGKKMAILTFAGDFTKGVMAVWFGRFFMMFYTGANPLSEIVQYGVYAAGIMCILGHIYPCFFKFKGGKGVLTAWAVTLLIDWRVFLMVIGVFLIILLITKIISVASLSAALSYPLATFLITYFINFKVNNNLSFLVFTTFTSLIISATIIYKHKSNIVRILNGTEKKIKIHK